VSATPTAQENDRTHWLASAAFEVSALTTHSPDEVTGRDPAHLTDQVTDPSLRSLPRGPVAPPF